MLGRQGCNLKLSKRQSQARFSLFLSFRLPPPPPLAFNPLLAEGSLASSVPLDSPSPTTLSEGTQAGGAARGRWGLRSPRPPAPPRRGALRTGAAGKEGAGIAALRGGAASAPLLWGLSGCIGRAAGEGAEKLPELRS